MLAPDGKPYDINNLSDISEDEVEIIQYLRPDARRRKMACQVGKDLVSKVKELDLIISAEELITGDVCIYIRKKSESCEKERMRFATNGPGPKNPQNVLIEMIKAEDQ